LVDLRHEDTNVYDVKGVFEWRSVRRWFEIGGAGKVVKVRRRHSLVEMVSRCVFETLADRSSAEVDAFLNQELRETMGGAEKINVGEGLGGLSVRPRNAAAASHRCDSHCGVGGRDVRGMRQSESQFVLFYTDALRD
jgi:hypothetical protein